jgi:aminoglycoside phosphotransferase (APT) family kinase protein
MMTSNIRVLPERVLQDFIARGHVVETVVPCTGAWTNAVFRVRTSKGCFVVKITPDPTLSIMGPLPHDYLALASPDRLNCEVDALRLVGPHVHDDLLPDIEWYDSVGRALVLLDYSGGASVTLNQLPSNLIDHACIRALASFVSRLLDLPKDCLSPLRGQRESAARTAKLRHGYLLPVLRFAHHSRDLVAIRDFFEAAKDIDTHLTHGDFHARNVLVSPAGALCVVDWEEAMMHDPIYDAAIMTASLVLKGVQDEVSGGHLPALGATMLRDAVRGITMDAPGVMPARQRASHYMAGHLLDRLHGLGRDTEIRTDRIRQRLYELAHSLLRTDTPDAVLLEV